MHGIIYLVTSPNSDEAILGFGRDLNSVKTRLKNAKCNRRSAYFANLLIKEEGGLDNWNFVILEEIYYYNRSDLYKLFVNYYKSFGYPGDGACVNNEVIPWKFEQAVW